jgi:hypothetical protein
MSATGTPPEVHWRPGGPASSSMRIALAAPGVAARRWDIWTDPEAAGAALLRTGWVAPGFGANGAALFACVRLRRRRSQARPSVSRGPKVDR